MPDTKECIWYVSTSMKFYNRQNILYREHFIHGSGGDWQAAKGHERTSRVMKMSYILLVLVVTQV